MVSPSTAVPSTMRAWRVHEYGEPLDVLRLDIGAKLDRRARAYAAATSSACWWYPTTSVVFVSERPHTLEKYADGRLKRAAWSGWEVVR